MPYGRLKAGNKCYLSANTKRTYKDDVESKALGIEENATCKTATFEKFNNLGERTPSPLKNPYKINIYHLHKFETRLTIKLLKNYK